jgi:hypothetical protein
MESKYPKGSATRQSTTQITLICGDLSLYDILLWLTSSKTGAKGVEGITNNDAANEKAIRYLAESASSRL